MPTASVHPMVVGRSDALALAQAGALWRSSEERSEAPDEPMVSRETSVHSMYYVPETMSSAQEPRLQHRLNRWSIGDSTGVMTSVGEKEANS